MKRLCYLFLFAGLIISVSSCSGGEDYWFDPSIGVMLHEGAWIDETMETSVSRIAGSQDGVIISLMLRSNGTEGYTAEQRRYMESLYPSLVVNGLHFVRQELYMRYVKASSSLTLAGVLEGAKVTADKTIAGIPAGEDIGGLLTLYAVSRDNALRYSYPGFRVKDQFYWQPERKSFSEYYSPGLTLPGLYTGSCVCFALTGCSDAVTLTFTIPFEYSFGSSFTYECVISGNAEVFNKTLNATVTINPSDQMPDFDGKDLLIQ